MLARKGIFTTPSITQSHVSVIRALARVACITNHLHIFFQDRLAVEESNKNPTCYRNRRLRQVPGTLVLRTDITL